MGNLPFTSCPGCCWFWGAASWRSVLRGERAGLGLERGREREFRVLEGASNGGREQNLPSLPRAPSKPAARRRTRLGAHPRPFPAIPGAAAGPFPAGKFSGTRGSVPGTAALGTQGRRRGDPQLPAPHGEGLAAESETSPCLPRSPAPPSAQNSRWQLAEREGGGGSRERAGSRTARANFGGSRPAVGWERRGAPRPEGIFGRCARTRSCSHSQLHRRQRWDPQSSKIPPRTAGHEGWKVMLSPPERGAAGFRQR